ncbi:hypothetical protein KL86DYS1_11135 [uncultured Dysgonomonas sp.]|uniref:Uncharacterized protein n=1 Tax=uncultured Dysgonomonas sp. TaxID=206096 RepID=A0A212J4Z9_9BACT|nr:hypothetical protein KL86DYS1_11135 [uncultured Dysgonomonas sp.]
MNMSYIKSVYSLVIDIYLIDLFCKSINFFIIIYQYNYFDNRIKYFNFATYLNQKLY